MSAHARTHARRNNTRSQPAVFTLHSLPLYSTIPTSNSQPDRVKINSSQQHLESFALFSRCTIILQLVLKNRHAHSKVCQRKPRFIYGCLHASQIEPYSQGLMHNIEVAMWAQNAIKANVSFSICCDITANVCL